MVEPGISVGGSGNISGCSDSGEAICCRSVFVNVLIHFRRAAGGSEASCVCLNALFWFLKGLVGQDKHFCYLVFCV